MPTYNYECRSCGHAFELFQSMTAPVKRKCPTCGKPRLDRLIGAGSGVLFKGSGFYQTDYRSASYRSGEKTANTGETKKTADSGSKTGKSTGGPAKNAD
jgi:putative FmdB family regulatory protein